MNTDDMPVVEMRGNARERGRAYGETCRELIGNSLATWRNNLDYKSILQRELEPDKTRPRSEAEIDAYLTAFRDGSTFASAIEVWAPDLLEEVKGIAEGAGHNFEAILALQLGDEEWNFGMRRGLERPINKCTAFGLARTESVAGLAGQNLDVPQWMEGHQVLLDILPDDAPEALVFSYAGGIALNGMNAAGLGITCNGLPMLDYSPAGIPVAFVVRLILKQRDHAAAARLLRSLPHASGQNYILSSGESVACFECCGTGTAEVFADARGRVFHTNHALASSALDPHIVQSARAKQSTMARQHAMVQRLGQAQSENGLDAVKAALSSHDDAEFPVSVPYDPDNAQSLLTAGSSIYEFSVPPRLHLAAGPPCVTPYRTYDFMTAAGIS